MVIKIRLKLSGLGGSRGGFDQYRTDAKKPGFYEKSLGKGTRDMHTLAGANAARNKGDRFVVRKSRLHYFYLNALTQSRVWSMPQQLIH